MAPAAAHEGVLRDASGAAVADAEVQILNARQAVLAGARTDAEGRFTLTRLPEGRYVLRVRRPGLAERRLPLEIRAGDLKLEVVLDRQPVQQSVTVTATPGRAEAAERAPLAVNSIGAAELAERVKSFTAQLAAEEPGVAVQRTSPTIGGVYVRGLTGNKVNVFVDGVRYSTSAQRGGISTFFNLLAPSAIESVEILRGPSSAQYGSDALGGSVQVMARPPSLGAGGFHQEGGLSFQSADAGFGASWEGARSGERLGVLTGFAGQRSSRLRTGGGIDSHSAVTRFLGLPSAAAHGSRMPDTAFTQYGGRLRLQWLAGADSQLVLHYQRSQQDGGKRADQLLGGDGNLVADLRNLMLDFGYVRYMKARLGPLDDFAATFSINSQREERVNQGGAGNPLAMVTHEYERTTAIGTQVGAGKRIGRRVELSTGGDYYRESVRSPSYGMDPLTGIAAPRRGRIPDGARHHWGGAYLGGSAEAPAGRLRVQGSLRYDAASYRARLWREDTLTTASAAFRGGALFTVVSGLSIVGNVARGFRSPHITDLGTLGLTGSGFEVASADVAGWGAAVGSTAGPDAVSTGIPVAQVRPETALGYEAGLRWRNSRARGELLLFQNNIGDNIAKQAIILPPSAVGRSLGGETITAQNSNGTVLVAASPNPVLVRANFGDARLWGIESRVHASLARAWTASATFTWIRAREPVSGLPPNIEGGTPAPAGNVKLRYTSRGARWWVEPYLLAADRQARLSSLDLQDRRTGAARSRASIAAFYRHGAAARGIQPPGTLAEVQDRVLGRGVDWAPMYAAVPGYAVAGLRGGIRFGERHSVIFEAENLADRNYRGISWGLDGPGRGACLRYRFAY
jgi:outer membrane receptor protein involved in Fe transport